MLTPDEEKLVLEALQLVANGLSQLAAASSNGKVQLVVKILESGLSVAEMMIGTGS